MPMGFDLGLITIWRKAGGEAGHMDILEMINANYASFGAARKRIADYILGAPEMCCFATLKSFSAQANVTESTVLSFCKALGLGSYLDLKKALQDQIILRVHPMHRMQMAVNTETSLEKLHGQVVRAHKENLQMTFESNTIEALESAAGLLGGAGRIHIAAHNTSKIAGDYLNQRLLVQGMDSSLLDLQDRDGMYFRLSRSPAKDLLIAVSIPPYGKSTVSVVKYCVELGMPVAAITDRPSSPICQGAQVSLFCRVNLMGTTNTYASMLGLMDLLTMTYSFMTKGRGQVAGSAKCHERFSQLFPEEDATV
ncbi:MAG: MurR/RpiR family transcriptional regulator [Lachnospiraceae bacterium]|nr:MurR/RpiR family transcriptional regulator [Lachnospiraceae bacterium]